VCGAVVAGRTEADRRVRGRFSAVQRRATMTSRARRSGCGWGRQQLPVRPHHLISSVVVDAEGTVSWGDFICGFIATGLRVPLLLVIQDI
jgi:hypothetical protein